MGPPGMNGDGVPGPMVWGQKWGIKLYHFCVHLVRKRYVYKHHLLTIRGYLAYQECKEKWDLKGKDCLDLRSVFFHKAIGCQHAHIDTCVCVRVMIETRLLFVVVGAGMSNKKKSYEWVLSDLCIRVTEVYQGSQAHLVLLGLDFMDQRSVCRHTLWIHTTNDVVV